jgi:hypothetical protein
MLPILLVRDHHGVERLLDGDPEAPGIGLQARERRGDAFARGGPNCAPSRVATDDARTMQPEVRFPMRRRRRLSRVDRRAWPVATSIERNSNVCVKSPMSATVTGCSDVLSKSMPILAEASSLEQGQHRTPTPVTDHSQAGSQ